MSHKKLREEKNCLNCGQQVDDRYCSHCGQENLPLHDSAIHLILHYIQDLFHYDGKLWHTLKNLLVKPGQVAVEFMEGKRKQNLEPVRNYVFASTVFFLVLFFIVGKNTVEESSNPELNFSKRIFNLEQEKNYLGGSPDTAHINPLIEALEQKAKGPDSLLNDSPDNRLEIDLFQPAPDTQQVTGWLGKALVKKLESRQAEMEKEYEGDEIKALRAYLIDVFHKLPQLFFLSMPFFAFFLKLLYWRSFRNVFVEHFIFSIYLYAYIFSIMTFYILLVEGIYVIPESNARETIISWISTGIVLYPFIYLFLAMRRFYQDTWGKMTIRYLVLLFLMVMIILILFVAIALFTLLW